MEITRAFWKAVRRLALCWFHRVPLDRPRPVLTARARLRIPA